MYKKVCDRCFRPSYSSSERGKWICPTCSKDLAHVKRSAAEQHYVNPFEKERRPRKVIFIDFATHSLFNGRKDRMK